ncbi:MAG: MATE family efflux transporter [Treponema sp.]|jgi:putative MATE family efflux protein|nr:MATE family efflux transporter [Treponema sp.]
MRTDMTQLMEKEPAARAVIRLALPMMLAMIAQMVYNMTDTFFIGQTGDPNMVAGISLTMPLFMVSQGIGNIFAVGSASYISRKLGEKNTAEARHTNAASFYTTIGFGLVITAVLLVFKTPILHLIGTSEATFPYADSYFTVITWFMVFAVVNIGLSGQIRSEGATGKAMKGMLLGIIANIVLDPVFILLLDWGVAGAAWATIIGQIASVGYFIRHFTSKHTILSIKVRDCKPNAVMYKEILKIGVPAALSHIIMTFCAILTNIIAASYGDFVVAGGGISMRVTSISFMLIMALAQGFQPFAGYNYGARNYTRLRQGLKVTLLYTTSLACFFLVVFFAAGPALITLFIRDEPTVRAGTSLIRAFVWGLPFMGIQMTFMVTFQALGKPVLATVVTLGRQFLFYLPLLFILNHFWQFNGYIYSQPAADMLTSIVALALSSVIFREMHGQSSAAEIL